MPTGIRRKRSSGPRAGIGGRPSTFDKELCASILEKIADGETIQKACKDAGIYPRTFLGWAELNPEFDLALDRARRIGFAIRAERYGERADEVLEGVQGAGKDEGPSVSAANALANHYRWNMEKLLPKVYGNVSRVEQRSIVTVKDERDALRDKILEIAGGDSVRPSTNGEDQEIEARRDPKLAH